MPAPKIGHEMAGGLVDEAAVGGWMAMYVAVTIGWFRLVADVDGYMGLDRIDSRRGLSL